MAEEDSFSSSATTSQEQEQLENRNLIVPSVAADHHTDDLTEASTTLSGFAGVKLGTGSVKKLVIRNFKGNIMIIL